MILIINNKKYFLEKPITVLQACEQAAVIRFKIFEVI